MLLKVEFNELVDRNTLDFDLYNEQGNIVYKKNHKIDSGFLLMLKYMNLYKENTGSLQQNSQEKPEIVDFTRQLLLLGIKKRTDEIHIEPEKDCLIIKYLIKGSVCEEININSSFFMPITSYLKQLAQLNIEEASGYQEGNITISLSIHTIEYKVSFFSTQLGKKVILKLVEENKDDIPDLSEIFLPKHIYDELIKIENIKNGILFATGPALSGKTLTLFSFIKHLKKENKNIITIENPIKYRLSGITQIQKNLVNKSDFNSVLLEVMKLQPDILMIKGIFDREAIKLSLHTALTDYFTLETMHAKSAAHFLATLINMNIPTELLGATIIGVLSQKLVKKLCDHCKEPYKLSPDDITKLFIWDRKTEVTFYRAKECPQCSNTGYSGQIPIYELLIMNDDIRNYLAQNPNLEQIKKYLKHNNFKDMRYDGIKKVLRGLTTIEEVDKVLLEEE